jgi:hypothetical protein
VFDHPDSKATYFGERLPSAVKDATIVCALVQLTAPYCRKFLSCVFASPVEPLRRGDESHYQVLTGAETEKAVAGISSAYDPGIGPISAAEWAAIGRAAPLGYLRQSGGQFPIVEMRAGLVHCAPQDHLTHQALLRQKRAPRAGREKSCDEALLGRLRKCASGSRTSGVSPRRDLRSATLVRWRALSRDQRP